MVTVISDVLTPEETAAARETLTKVAFVDGRATAGWAAKLVKNNLQASGADIVVQSLRETLSAKISNHPLFRLVARPKALTPLILSRYEPGMAYGSHVDDALMNGVRSDVSFTLFLSEEDSYEGGALVIETSAGEEDIRLPAGSMVVYSSTTLHRVAEVTKGARLAAVGWARSFIRDPARREMLFDLDTARQSLFQKQGKTAEFDLLSKTSANLLRMWAED
ncbi:MAG TPA: Fe2+-dependent dioxygenase [Bauldia sp.]|nr:Fe2+-dependent dioxygenase [Bauldia sp.]